MVSVSIWVMVTYIHRYVQIHPSESLRFVHFTECKLYFNLKKKNFQNLIMHKGNKLELFFTEQYVCK